MTRYKVFAATLPDTEVPLISAHYPIQQAVDLFAFTRTPPHTNSEHWKLLLKLAESKGALDWQPFRTATLIPLLESKLSDEYGICVSGAIEYDYKYGLAAFGYDGVILDYNGSPAVFFVEQAVHTNMLNEERIADYWLSKVDDMVDTCALLADSGLLFNSTRSWGRVYAYNLKTAENWYLEGRNLYHLSPAVTAKKGVFLLHSALSAVKKLGDSLE